MGPDDVPPRHASPSTRGVNGGLVLGEGRELTVTAIMALRNLLATGSIEEPLLVACPDTARQA